MTEVLEKAARASAPLRRRIIGTLLPAAIGCALGYLYGERYGDPDLIETLNLPGLYATLGAVVGILCVRLGVIVWMVLRDIVRGD